MPCGFESHLSHHFKIGLVFHQADFYSYVTKAVPEILALVLIFCAVLSITEYTDHFQNQKLQ